MTEPMPLVRWEARGGGWWWVSITTTAGVTYSGMVRASDAETVKPHK